MNLETCEICHAKYLRDFDTDKGRSDHRTGRRCNKYKCRGKLIDSVIGFGESLPRDEHDKAFDHAEKADVCLVLGKIIVIIQFPSY